VKIQYLLPSAALIYSEIIDLVRNSPPVKSTGFSFSRKVKNGVIYWYLQQKMGIYRKRFLIGSEDKGARELIKHQREAWDSAKTYNPAITEC